MFLEGKCRISEVICELWSCSFFMKNDLSNNNFLVDIVHVVPIVKYIVCSCIFLLLNLEKYARSMIFFFLFLVVKFSYFRVGNVTV